jgi:hypothetical protein
MSKIALSGNASGTGTLTLAAPNTNSDRTLTLPDNSGTLLSNASTFAGTGPAFSAYASTDQSFSASTWTKITSVFISFSGSPPSITQTAIYKNGSGYRSGYMAHTTSGPYGAAEVSDIVYLDGSTDYVEIYVWSNSATAFVDAAVSSVPTAFFSGALVRAA